jgi:hypothetical protein
MAKKYKAPTPSEIIVLIGENFMVNHLYNNFKRYSKLKTHQFKSIQDVDEDAHYIIDISFNEKSQNDVLKYAVENNIKKVVILNHWKKFINEFKDLIIVQAIIPDVYGEEHISFSRPGSGNNYDSPISYCSLICESIRRIHEAKVGFIPNLYIQYGEDTVKYLYVENLYEPIQYIIDEIHETSEYEIFDEYKNAGSILDIIKEAIEYKGNVEFINTRTSYNKPMKKLPYQHSYKSFTSNVKNIYKYLIYNHERYMNIY